LGRLYSILQFNEGQVYGWNAYRSTLGVGEPAKPAIGDGTLDLLLERLRVIDFEFDQLVGV
jgi:hypothetical protein